MNIICSNVEVCRGVCAVVSTSELEVAWRVCKVYPGVLALFREITAHRAAKQGEKPPKDQHTCECFIAVWNWVVTGQCRRILEISVSELVCACCDLVVLISSMWHGWQVCKPHSAAGWGANWGAVPTLVIGCLRIFVRFPSFSGILWQNFLHTKCRYLYLRIYSLYIYIYRCVSIYTYIRFWYHFVSIYIIYIHMYVYICSVFSFADAYAYTQVKVQIIHTDSSIL